MPVIVQIGIVVIEAVTDSFKAALAASLPFYDPNFVFAESDQHLGIAHAIASKISVADSPVSLRRCDRASPKLLPKHQILPDGGRLR